MIFLRMIERRKVIIILFSILILIFVLVHWLSDNRKRTFNKWQVLENYEELIIRDGTENDHLDGGTEFGPNNFDEALLINGPKYSQFETEESRQRSIKLVKQVAAKSFDYQPLPDEKIDTDYRPVEYYLNPGLVPPEVHVIWCRGGDDRVKKSQWFEYKTYLTVLSSLRTLKPDKVNIYFEKLPEKDRVIYHQWMDWLKTDYPWLYIYTLSEEHKNNFCISDKLHSKLEVIFSLLDPVGGIFIGENTWILNYPPSSRGLDVDYAFHLDADGTTDGYIMMRKGLYSEFVNKQQQQQQQQTNLIETFVKEIIQSSLNPSTSFKDDDQDTDLVESLTENPVIRKTFSENIKRSSCFKIQQIYTDERLRNTSKCAIVRGGAFDRFYPMDIWQLDDPFGRLARKLFYGSERIRLPVPKYDSLVPNIAHMIWIGGKEIDYVFYLSVLSLLFVAKVDKVYIHGDIYPPGELWNDLMKMENTKNKIKFITRTQPHMIYQEEVEKGYYSLMSDLIRVDIMIKYGGIYTDTDAIWVKPLSRAERGYDAVASYDWIDWSWPYQDTVNFGISYGKRNAPFWRIFRDSMRKLYNDVHGFTGVMMPYKLLERYPELLRIDRRLSVICYHSKCHPTYFPGYHDEKKDHTNTNSIPDWKKELHAFHWTHPNPTEFFNRTTLLSASGIFAELGRNVLVKAGLL